MARWRSLRERFAADTLNIISHAFCSIIAMLYNVACPLIANAVPVEKDQPAHLDSKKTELAVWAYGSAVFIAGKDSSFAAFAYDDRQRHKKMTTLMPLGMRFSAVSY